MSKVLSSLVARSFGTAVVARPRLTSLFEPVCADVAPFRNTYGDMNEGMPSFAEEEKAVVQSPQRKRTESQVIPIAATNNNNNDRRTDELSDKPSVLIPSRPPQGRNRAIAAEILRETDGNKVGSQAPTTSTDTLERWGKTAPVDTVAFTRQDVADRSLFVSGIDPRRGTLIVETHSLAPSRERHQPALQQKQCSLIVPKLTPGMRISDLALSVRSDRRPRQNDRSTEMDTRGTSEPSVQVTIGRIEVRATKESSQPSRPASASPVMSLQEYLRGRAQRVGQ
jgi:hypothetical protein